MAKTPTSIVRKAICRELKSEIARLEKAIRQVEKLDPELLAKAVDVFEGPDGAAQWLVAPQYGLAGKIPVKFARTEKGRAAVSKLLTQIDYGVYV